MTGEDIRGMIRPPTATAEDIVEEDDVTHEEDSTGEEEERSDGLFIADIKTVIDLGCTGYATSMNKP